MTQHSSQDNRNRRGSQRIAELLGKVLEPVIARRTGMQLELLTAWKDIIGPDFAETTRPSKINWPRRAHEDDPFEPAMLVVACEPSAALFFQHEQAGVLERVNLFFGFEAVNRIRIVQRPVADCPEPAPEPDIELSQEQKQAIADRLQQIEDPTLKATLQRLGQGILKRSEGNN